MHLSHPGTVFILTAQKGPTFYPISSISPVCKVLPRPVVKYGAETWTMMKNLEQALLIFERKIFKRMYGPK
jgi:hypothetical protein